MHRTKSLTESRRNRDIQSRHQILRTQFRSIFSKWSFMWCRSWISKIFGVLLVKRFDSKLAPTGGASDQIFWICSGIWVLPKAYWSVSLIALGPTNSISFVSAVVGVTSVPDEAFISSNRSTVSNTETEAGSFLPFLRKLQHLLFHPLSLVSRVTAGKPMPKSWMTTLQSTWYFGRMG